MDETVTDDVRRALAEDIASGDISSALAGENMTVTAQVTGLEDIILCGCRWFEACFYQLAGHVVVSWNYKDGQKIKAGEKLCQIKGDARTILSAERSALNFLQTLSGCAAKTGKYVAAVKGSGVKITDTRKTVPGLRTALKYAVKTGGGENHRMGLYDAYLLKENHIAALGSFAKAVRAARSSNPQVMLEVEVENLEEFAIVRNLDVDRILLDNFGHEMIKQAVKSNSSGIKLEISGNVTLDNVSEYASLGVDYISVGDLTKNIKAADLSLRIL